MPTPFQSSYLDRSSSLRDGRDRGASLLGHSSYARVGVNDGGEDEARSPPLGSTTGRGTMGGYSDPYNPRSTMMGSSSGGWSDSKKERRKHANSAESDEELEMGQRRAASGQRGERDSLMGRNVFVVHHDGGGAPVTVFTDAGTEIVELPPSYLNASPTEGPSSSGRPSSSSASQRRQQTGSPPVLGQPVTLSPPSRASHLPSSRPDPFTTPPVNNSELPALPPGSAEVTSTAFSPPTRTNATSPPLPTHPSGPNRAVSRMSSSGPGVPAPRMGPRPLPGPRGPSDKSTGSR